MSFLIDMPISPQVAQWLTEKGYDVVHASQIGLSRAKDSAQAAGINYKLKGC